MRFRPFVNMVASQAISGVDCTNEKLALIIQMKSQWFIWKIQNLSIFFPHLSSWSQVAAYEET